MRPELIAISHFEIDFPTMNFDKGLGGTYSDPKTAAYYSVYLTARNRYLPRNSGFDGQSVGDAWDLE